MVRIRVRSSSRLGAISRRLRGAASGASYSLALAAVETATEEIRSRIQPSGAAQKQLRASTISRKGHDHPLIHKGVLVDRHNWRIDPAGHARWRVSPPADREKISAALNRRGFIHFDPGASRLFAARRSRISDELVAEIERG